MLDSGKPAHRRPFKSRRLLMQCEPLEGRELLAAAIVAAPTSAPSATAAFSVVNDWGSGFTGEVALTNDGSAPINGWTLQFEFEANLTQIWNARIVSHVGTRYVVQDAGYNAAVAPGQTVSFGFNGAPGRVAAPPSGYVLNGTPLGGTDPNPNPGQAPTVTSAAAAAANPVAGTSASLSVLGADDGGEGRLTYSWATVGTPPAPVSFSQNGSNAAKSTTAVFTEVGAYSFRVTITDEAGLSVTSDVGVTVAPTLTRVAVSPSTATVAAGSSKTFSAQGFDQFGAPLTAQPAWTWSVAAGAGTVDGAGVYTAPTTSGTATVRAAAGGVDGSASITVEDPATPGPSFASAVYNVVDDWGSGFTGEVALTSHGTAPINGWTLQFDFGADITEIWNARIVSHVGTRYVVQDAGYNAAVAPGGTVSFGFNGLPGDGGAGNAPTNYVLNGVPLDGTGAVLPTITVGDVTVAAPTGQSDSGYFQTSGNQIVNGQGVPVKIAGVNWFGFETSTYVPHGLWARSYRDMMDQMVQLGFNTIRLPFSNAIFNPANIPNSINYSLNPDLQGLSSLQILDKIVDYAGQIGLRIILDHHSALPDNHANETLWYIPGDAANTEQVWINNWVALAQRYAGDPTVIGADLKNEPHGEATWGDGNLATDWRLAAQRAGNAVLAVNPNWLIFVEGIETYNGRSTWWGGNLEGAREHPVVLNVPNRVVYSPHDYPASVYNQPWFSAGDYPNNLEAVWDQNWGYLYRENLAPVWLGELGSKLETTSDQLWYQQITGYLGDLASSSSLAGRQGMSWTWWSWNPNSSDTGGILQADWKTPNANKVQGLIPIQFALPPAGGPATVTATFVVTLSAPSNQAVAVAFATADGSATQGKNYVASQGVLTFAPGQTQAVVSVTVLYDPTLADDAAFYLVLTDPTNSTLDGTGRATVTIRKRT